MTYLVKVKYKGVALSAVQFPTWQAANHFVAATVTTGDYWEGDQFHALKYVTIELDEARTRVQRDTVIT